MNTAVAVGTRTAQALALVTTAALALSWHGLEPALANSYAAAAILVFGLPHGGFDRLIAVAVLGTGPKRRFSTGLFVTLYLVVAAMTACAWLAAPSFMLAVFLALSAVHFGMGDRAGPPSHQILQIMVNGGAVIILLPFFHPAEVTRLFTYLADPAGARLLLAALRMLAPAWLAAFIVHSVIAISRKRRVRRIAEPAILAIVFAALPPLLGFLLYFGCLHGPRHMATSLAYLNVYGLSPRTALTEAALLALVALTGFVIVGLASPSGLGEETVQRTLFVGLAALTVPHMLLIDALGPGPISGIPKGSES